MRVGTVATACAVLATGVLALNPNQYALDKPKRVQSLFEIQPAPGTCLTACYVPLNLVQWSDMKPDSYWGMRLSSTAWMTSLVACMSSYCTKKEAADGWARLHEYRTFQPTEAVVPPYETVLRKVDPNAPIVDCVKMKGQLYNGTILSTFGNFKNGWRTGFAMQRQLALHNMFGLSMFVFLGVLVMIGMAYRAWAFLSRRSAKDVEGGYVSLSTRSHSDCSDVYTWYKKHLGTPSVGGRRHLQPAWWGFLSLPTRIEACLIFTYVVVNVYFSCVEYDLFYDNFYWYGQLDIQLARYLSDRTGIMSFYNMVLLWALAGRNDVIIWLTGWSFQSMNLFHRWAARVATVQAIIHSIGYSYIKRGALLTAMRDRFWATGVFATIVMSLILPLSIRPVRVKMYEAFLLFHIAFSAVLLILLYYHVVQFGYLAWIWICCGLWAFDRLIRIGRVLLLNVKAIGGPNATATLTASDGLIRLAVETATELTPRPGDYYFIYSPVTITPWENHPFTLASAEPLSSGGVRLHFLIMPLAGWTGRLAKLIEEGRTKGQDTVATRVLVEGPYGHAADVSKYDHVLLIAGGSGIAAVLPYLATLPGRKVTMVWMVRNAEYSVDVFTKELAPSIISDLPVELFVTRQDTTTAMSILQDECKIQQIAVDGDATDRSGPGVHITAGRPKMRHLLDAAIGRLLGNETLAVLACGPAVMMDNLREAVVESYGSERGQVSGSTLHYFEEAFVW